MGQWGVIKCNNVGTDSIGQRSLLSIFSEKSSIFMGQLLHFTFSTPSFAFSINFRCPWWSLQHYRLKVWISHQDLLYRFNCKINLNVDAEFRNKYQRHLSKSHIFLTLIFRSRISTGIPKNFCLVFMRKIKETLVSKRIHPPKYEPSYFITFSQ